MSPRTVWAAAAACFILVTFPAAAPLAGTPPNILIWQPQFTTSESGAALLADLQVLGEDAALVQNLFAFPADLSDHEIVMGVVGVTPDTHLLDAAEALAIDTFVQNGGLLYLEGGDCFNYDPDVLGGIDVRPIFGLSPGSDGDGVFFGDVVGVGSLGAFGFDFDYLGEPSFLDELIPVTSSPILRKKTQEDVLAVFNPAYGGGRSIAFSCEYGGLFDFPGVRAEGLTMRQRLLAACLELLRTGGTVAVPGATVPLALALHPAAPNPAKGGTTIRFDLPRAVHARLSIFDLSGRLIRTLASGLVPAGSHTLPWDIRDDAGNRVASGMYFLALEAEQKSVARSVVVMK